jgi:hypothetical protein
MKDDETFGLHNKFDEWLARIVAYAFGMSPVAFVQMTNRAVSQEMGDVEAEQGLASIKFFIERLVNDIIDEVIMLPHLRFNWVTDRSRMQSKVVDKNVKYVQAGIYTADEVRAEEGKPPLVVAQPMAPMDQTSYGMDEEAVDYETGPDYGQDAGTGYGEYEAAAKALSDARNRELSTWKTYAVKRFKNGKPVTGFRPEYVDDGEAKEIEQGLTKAASLDAIAHLFASRKKKVAEVRIPPPRPSDGNQQRNDLKSVLKEALEAEAIRVASGRDVETQEKRASASAHIPAITITPHVHIPEQKAPVVNFNPTINVPQAPAPEVRMVNEISLPKQAPPQIVNKVEVPPSPPAHVDVHVPAPNVYNTVESPAAPPVQKRSKIRKAKIVRDSEGKMKGLEFEETEE